MPVTDREFATTLVATIAAELGLKADQVERTIALFDEGNTIPFVARYRKEVTGGLDEEQLRAVSARAEYLRNLSDRKRTVLDSIAEQGKLSGDLRARIEAAATLQEVEDLYSPTAPSGAPAPPCAREAGAEAAGRDDRPRRRPPAHRSIVRRNFSPTRCRTVEDACRPRDIVAKRRLRRRGPRLRGRSSSNALPVARARRIRPGRQIPPVLRVRERLGPCVPPVLA